MLYQQQNWPPKEGTEMKRTNKNCTVTDKDIGYRILAEEAKTLKYYFYSGNFIEIINFQSNF